MSDYSEKVCEACQPDADPATKEEINQFLSGNSDWQLIESDAIKKIERTYKFKNFRDALEFTNLVGEVAEVEGHHPQIVTCLLYTSPSPRDMRRSRMPSSA